MRGWDEVRSWRKAQRAALIARRLAVSHDDRTRWNGLITRLTGQALPTLERMAIGFY